MTITGHCLQRWAERFPDRDINQCLASARHRLTKREMKSLRDMLMNPANKKHTTRHTFTGRYLRKTRDGIVFVIEHPDRVITAYSIPPVFEEADQP